MSTIENNSHASSASQLMAVEVISELLTSTSPQKLGEVLTDHLRELTGAKTVMVLIHRPEPQPDELLQVSPPRRYGLFSAEELNLFCLEKTPEVLPYTTVELPNHHPLKEVLTGAGIKSMARFSLTAGGELVGLLLLFDFPDISRFTETTTIIKLLVPPITLSLKNALAYNQIQQMALELERKVEERTAELIEKNAELYRNEERSRTVLQTAMDGFWLVGIDKCIIDVNEAYCQMSGYSRRELVGMHIKNLEVIDSEEVIVERGRRIAEFGGDRFESRHRHKDGSIYYVDVSIKCLHLDGDQFAVFVRDINDHKRAEEMLRDSEAKYRLLLDNLSSGVVVHAPDTSIVFANPMALALLGLSKDQIKGKTAIDPAWCFVQENGMVMPLEEYPVNQVLSSGRSLSDFVVGIRRPDLIDPLWVLCHAYPFYDAEEELEQVIITFSDISKLKQAEEHLVTLTQRLQLAASSARLGIWDWNVKENTMVWDDRMFELYGVTRESFPNSIDAWMNGLHPEDKEAAIAECQAALNGEKEFDTEFRVLHPDGIVKHIKCKGLVLWGADGTAERMLGINYDVTEAKRAEENKHKLESQLQQAQKMESVGRLAGGVAHDFNNMLSVILGHAELGLMHLDPTHPVCADLKEISKTAERSADLTRQLLAFARKQTVAPKVLNLNDSISEMLKMLQRLIGEDIHLTWQPAPDLWPSRMDPSQLDQILANLCVNARDAIEGNGSIIIETANRTIDPEYCFSNPEATPGEYVCLTVSDSGSGMDKETQTHIFEPFFTTKELGKGTGLGLATVYGAVKQNNGFINIYSEPGKGTTFSIYLPRDESSRSSQALSGIVAAPVPRGQETILLVEDEPAILNIASFMLETQGYTVLKAETPGDAVRLAREHSGEIQLLMTDVIMPEMNGRDLAKNLLSLYPNMKRLFMSGYTADAIATHGVLEEGVHFIQKPFSLSNMAAKVRDVLDSK